METTAKLTGTKEAVRVLACEHKIRTGLSMRTFRTAKGEMTECPKGCGQMKTSRVMAGAEMTAGQFVDGVRRAMGLE